MILFVKRGFAFGRIFLLAFVLVTLLVPEWPAFQEERFQIDAILGQRYFDFVTWAVKAIAEKSEAQLTAGENFLSEDRQKEFVLEYLDQLGQTKRLEGQINAIFADPSVNNPEEEARTLQDQADELRQELEIKQTVAESILQNQVATILNEEGFDVLGFTWPPVQMHMTPLPFVLIVSPREEIRQIYNLPLEHGLSTAEREGIESAIFDNVDRSALVSPIGGLGFYPAMIVETSDINYLVNTIAHEWAHHWLTLHPLGINIFANNELLTINETAASIVGNEIGRSVMERYYPEYLPLEEEVTDLQNDPSEPPPFDFNHEMRTTRIRVDELLEEGLVKDAEEYMEARRQFFWENGYRLRKLNQAYFAFRGSYADEPGEQGDDPIGPTLLAIRKNSPSLRVFLDRLSSVTSLDDLQELSLELDLS